MTESEKFSELLSENENWISFFLFFSTHVIYYPSRERKMSQYLTRQVLTRLKRLILPNTHQTKPHHSINMLLHHFPFKRNHRACFPFLKDRRQDIFKSNIHHVYIHIIIIIRIRNKLTSSSSSMCSHDHPPHFRWLALPWESRW